MKKTLTILSFLLALPAAMAVAEDDCFAPMATWQPKEAVADLAARNGWIVRRIKIDDGCYEIIGTDAEGRSIEVTVHPQTLTVIALEYEADNADKDEDDRPHTDGEDHGDD